jgi:hypothetical protein
VLHGNAGLARALLYGRFKEKRMQIKATAENASPRVRPPQRFLRASDRRPAASGHPFQAWIQAAALPDKSPEARLTGAVGPQTQPALPDAALERLSSRVVQAVRAAPASMHPHKVVVAFHSGWLQGVTCAVVVEGRRIRLRIRADGARQRIDLRRGRKILTGRLRSVGFDLGEYEVSP